MLLSKLYFNEDSHTLFIFQYLLSFIFEIIFLPLTNTCWWNIFSSVLQGNASQMFYLQNLDLLLPCSSLVVSAGVTAWGNLPFSHSGYRGQHPQVDFQEPLPCKMQEVPTGWKGENTFPHFPTLQKNQNNSLNGEKERLTQGTNREWDKRKCHPIIIQNATGWSLW